MDKYTTCQLNLYDTDQTLKSNSFQFNCLNYHIYRGTLAYQGSSNVIDEVIPYCFHSTNNFDESLEAFFNPLSQNLSFEQLRTTNIASQQLLSWLIPMEVSKRYHFYPNELNSLLNGHFYNLTELRLGLQCQYSFTFAEGMSFDQIVQAAFRGRIVYSESSDMMVPMPCYVFLECHRNGRLWYLNCREVCDGKNVYFDESLHEESCFDMEINECSEDEYRWRSFSLQLFYYFYLIKHEIQILIVYIVIQKIYLSPMIFI
jgi:hypothetical protein